MKQPEARLDQSRGADLIRAIFGILLVPALWPLGFIGVAVLFPTAIDPLLGGLQDVLYLPAFLWLLTILGVTVAGAKLFKLRVSNALFMITGVCCALVLALIFGGFSAWNTYQMIGAPGVIYPDRFDVWFHLRSSAAQATFLTALTLVTTGAFVGVGGLRRFKPQPA